MSFKINKVKAQEIRDKLVDDILHLEKQPVLTMQIPEEFRLDGWVYVLSNVAMRNIQDWYDDLNPRGQGERSISRNRRAHAVCSGAMLTTVTIKRR